MTKYHINYNDSHQVDDQSGSVFCVEIIDEL